MICPLGSTFFGLTSKYREYIFSQIHEIVFHGKGGYDWNTVYNMPIWLRNFTYRKIEEHYNDLNSQSNKAEKSWVDPSNKSKAKKESPQINPPSFLKAAKSQTSYK